MKYSSLLFVFFLAGITACSANNDWAGEWKLNDKNRYMSLTIKSTDKAELELFYDEGIGINGIRINGAVKLAGNDIAFVETFVRGERCKLKLQLSQNAKSKTLSLSNCELDSYDEEPGNVKIFIPKSQKLYYKASFNCAKAGTKIEFSICESKTLATADRNLGAIYKSLRKSLPVKNKRRLKTEQRQWVKQRNKSCEKQGENNIGYCLRQYYGQRLMALNILQDYKIWYSGEPAYAMFRAIDNVKKENTSFNIMDNGLGLWLGGVMKRQLTDTGSYEIQKSKFVNNSFIFSGPYLSNPAEGFDPRAFNDKIFIEFSAKNGIWLALAADDERLIYTPKNKVIMNASEKFKSWIKDFDEPTIINVF